MVSTFFKFSVKRLGLSFRKLMEESDGKEKIESGLIMNYISGAGLVTKMEFTNV